MLWTLQWYIFRELGKTFVLTAIALTAILGMGGGVLNMIKVEQMTAGQLLRIMSIVLPLAGTLALPIAALFGAAVTYGRLSAANEFVACRSSGINIHLLFAPTVVISLVSALFTFLAFNYLIPGRVRNLDEFIRSDLSRIVLHQLHAPGRLPLAKDKYRIYGEEARELEEPGLPADTKLLLLRKVAFVEMDSGNWARYGTAEAVRIRFDRLDTEPTVQAELLGISLFDRENNRSLELERDQVSRERIPRRFPLKTKWLTLGELIHYCSQPEELPELRGQLAALRGVLARERFYRWLAADFAEPDAAGQPDCRLSFGDGQFEYTLEAQELTPDLHDYKPTFTQVRLVERGPAGTRTAVAGAGTVDLVRTDGDDFGKAFVHLFDGVTITRSEDPQTQIPRIRERFRAVALPDSIVGPIRELGDAELLDPAAEIVAGKAFQKKRADIVEDRAEFVREIIGVIHSRLAFSVSVFVLVILAAALGIIVRGAHVLTAFGISFVPSLVVIVTIIMGRQLTENSATMALGVGIIWGGIALVGVLDAWTLARILRR